MLLIFYNSIITVAYLFSLPYLIYKYITSDQREWRQRMGIFRSQELPPLGAIWIHAASMGEVTAAQPLVDEIRRQKPDASIYFTTMTRTGQARALDLFQKKATVTFIPLDTPWAVRRLMRRIRPAVLLLVETELWFNLIIEAKKTGASIYIANARLSEKSLKQYRLLAWGLPSVLRKIDGCFVQSEANRDRFTRLGIDADKITVAGSTKYDALLQHEPVEKTELRQSLGFTPTDFVIVAGSTRPGEEARLISAILQFPQTKWILAPRHLHRLSAVADLLTQHGISWRYLTAPAQDTQVIIVNTMGQLRSLYGIGQVAFVGGTLENYGGHNLLEPASQHCPVLFGPYTENCQDQADVLLEFGGGWLLENDEQIVMNLRNLIGAQNVLCAVGEKAYQAVQAKTGAASHVISSI